MRLWTWCSQRSVVAMSEAENLAVLLMTLTTRRDGGMAGARLSRIPVEKCCATLVSASVSPTTVPHFVWFPHYQFSSRLTHAEVHAARFKHANFFTSWRFLRTVDDTARKLRKERHRIATTLLIEKE